MPYTPPDLQPVPRLASLHEARERAIALLTDRYADDSISDAEFEARLSWLGAADSVARIDGLVADLAVPGAATPLAAPRFGGAPVEERLLAVMSSSARTGRWTMPPRLATRAIMSELVIDLRYASLPPDAEIELFALMANVRIIVPPEVVVEARLSPFMGAVRNEVSGVHPAGWVGPRLRVHGSCVMSEVRIDVLPRQY